MAASMRGMFCQNALGKVIRSSGTVSMDFRFYSNKAKKKGENSQITINLKTVYRPDVPQTERKVQPLSYQHELKLRREEANRSVLVQLAKDGIENQLYQCLERHGKIKKAFLFGHLNVIKKYMLVEFDKKSTIQSVFRDAGHFRSKAKVPVQSRLLYFESRSGQTRSYPIIYEDYKSHDIVNIKSLKSISEQIQHHHKSKCQSNLGTRLRFFICSTIEDMISGFLPHLRIEPFGSSVNGFGWWNCDLDMMIEMMPSHSDAEYRLKFLTKKIHEDERVYSQRSLELFGDMLQLVMPSCYNVTKILHARVPIVKFKYECANLECDLSFWNVSGAKMSELMYIFGETDPRVRPLVSVLKHWARAKVLTKTSPGPWPTNFTLLMLMIYYLQTCKILPSIRTMQEMAGPGDEFEIDGVKFSFASNLKKLSKTDNRKTLEELLVDFFTFYVNFDLKNLGISLIEASDFGKPDLSPMYIENPFEIGANISKNVSSGEIERLQAEMQQALMTLNSHNSARGSEPWGIMGLLVNGNGPPDMNFKVSELYPGEDSELAGESVESKTESEVMSVITDLSHAVPELSTPEYTDLSPPVAKDAEDSDKQFSNEMGKSTVT